MVYSSRLGGLKRGPVRRAFASLLAAALIGGAVSALPPRAAFAQGVDLFNWKSVNTQGMGYVTGVSIARQAPYDVYVRTDVGGAYRYDRTGDAWVPLFDAFNTNTSGGGIGTESIAADPTNPVRVYAAVNYAYGTTTDQYGNVSNNYGGEVLVSTNRGKTWVPTGLASAAHALYVGPNSDYRQGTGERLGVDPNKGNVLFFASSQNGVWTKNGAGAWAQVGGGLPAPTSLPGYYASGGTGTPNTNAPGYTFVVFDKTSGSAGVASRMIYAGAWGSGVWKSADSGVSWSLLAGSPQYPCRASIASDGTLYVTSGITGPKLNDAAGKLIAAPNSVFRFAGGAWTEIRPSDTNTLYTGVTVDPSAPQTVMVARDKQIWRSTNGGTTWGSPLVVTDANGYLTNAPGYYHDDGDSAGGVAAMAIDPANPKAVWWTNGYGVARTDDVTVAAPTWPFHTKNLEELDTNMVRVPPKAGGAALWAMTQDMIGFRYTSPDVVPQIKINPQNVPTDAQNAWANGTATVFPNPFPHVAGGTGIDYCYNQPDYGAFVGFHQWQYQYYGPYSAIYGATADNGVTWNAFAAVPTENQWVSWANNGAGEYHTIKATGGMIAMSPTNPQNMVWAPSGGVWPMATTDGGSNWYLCYNLDHDAQPNPYDAHNNDQVHYQNLPKSWPNIITPWISTVVLAADRADPRGKTFYYYDGFAFYYSTDGGANWHKSSASLVPWIIRSTVVPNPLKQGDVWMAFARNGGVPTPNKLYRSQDGGVTFSVVPGVDDGEFIAFGKNPNSTTVPELYLFGRVNGATQDTMYESRDLGATWARINDPATQQFTGITHMDADMRTAGLLYVATTGRGFMYGAKAASGAGGAGTGTGLLGTYWANQTETGTPAGSRTDGTVNFDWGTSGPGAFGIGPYNFSARWTGTVEAPVTGTYTFTTKSDDGVRLSVNGATVISDWTDHAPTVDSGTVSLTAGQKVPITMDYYQNGGGAVAKLSWSYPGTAQQVIPQTRLYPPAVAADSAQYNFEGGVQGWANAWGNATASVSSAQHYAGAQSLAVAINAPAAGDNAVRVLNAGATTPMPGAGVPVTFHVYVPAGAPISGVTAFSQDANWGNWSSNSVASLTPGQWNSVTLTASPSSVTPLNAFGVTFTTTGAWSGTCYIDSVSWQPAAPARTGVVRFAPIGSTVGSGGND